MFSSKGLVLKRIFLGAMTLLYIVAPFQIHSCFNARSLEIFSTQVDKLVELSKRDRQLALELSKEFSPKQLPTSIAFELPGFKTPHYVDIPVKFLKGINHRLHGDFQNGTEEVFRMLETILILLWAAPLIYIAAWVSFHCLRKLTSILFTFLVEGKKKSS